MNHFSIYIKCENCINTVSKPDCMNERKGSPKMHYVRNGIMETKVFEIEDQQVISNQTYLFGIHVYVVLISFDGVFLKHCLELVFYFLQ